MVGGHGTEAPFQFTGEPLANTIIRTQITVESLKLFEGIEHQPFTWAGGQPAALLVHGFPGTPAELRPLGASLHQLGWTVHGPLLPGFGPEIGTLFERRHAEWVDAVHNALNNLRQTHHPVLLVGYSMGAALALQVAVAQPPSGLILLAPFWKFGNWWQQVVGFLLKPFLRRMRPFLKADFSDPEVRRNVSNFLSGVNLDDPDVQQALRELSVPVSIFEQLHHVGQAAYRQAGRAALPTLVIQGLQDEVSRLPYTRRLLQRLPGPLQYMEVNVGHDLVNPERQSWRQIEQTVQLFAQTLAR